MAEFEAARTVGGALWIGVWHPFVSGRLSRWLRIEYMLGTGEVWFARLEDGVFLFRSGTIVAKRSRSRCTATNPEIYSNPRIPTGCNGQPQRNAFAKDETLGVSILGVGRLRAEVASLR